MWATAGAFNSQTFCFAFHECCLWGVFFFSFLPCLYFYFIYFMGVGEWGAFNFIVSCLWYDISHNHTQDLFFMNQPCLYEADSFRTPSSTSFCVGWVFGVCLCTSVRCPCASVWCCKVSLCVSMMWGSCMCQLMWHINIFPSTDCHVNFVLGYGVICQPAQYCVILCCTVPDGSLSAMSFGVTVVSVGCDCRLQDTMSFGVTVVSVCCNCHLQDTMSFHAIVVPGVSILLSARDTMSFSVTVVANLPACSVRHSAILY